MYSFEWSSPTRRTLCGRILEPIPLEIYQEIFEYFCETDDMPLKEVTQNLSNMALVCRYFSAIALPRIFARFHFPGVTNDKVQVSRTNRFCRALINNQEPAKTLAQYVKSCTFSSWLDHRKTESFGRVSDAFLTMYCNALMKMSSVESIIFNCVLIDKCILKALKNLRHIEILSFCRCSVAPNLGLDQLTKFLQSLRLKSLTLCQWDNKQTHILSIDISPAFVLDTLTSLEIDSWTIIQRLAEHDSPLPLQTLTIHEVQDTAVLPTLFSNLPELLHLHVYLVNTHAVNLDHIHFSESIIPKLSSFDGPPALAELLVPSRPVNKVWLPGSLVGPKLPPPLLPPLTLRLWEALGKSTGVIRELFLLEHLYFVASVRNYLPDVATLKVSWSHGNWDTWLPFHMSLGDVEQAVTEFCEAWPPNPSIRHLALEFSPVHSDFPVLFNLQSQHEMINSLIVTAFPNIERVNFVTTINWRRNFSDNTWHAEIPKSKRRYLWKMHRASYEELMDYGGCFEAVFDPSNPDYCDYAK